MTTNSGVRICDKTQISQWRDERAAQDAAHGLSAEELAATPAELAERRAQYADSLHTAGAVVWVLGATVLAALVAIAIIAEVMGPRW